MSQAWNQGVRNYVAMSFLVTRRLGTDDGAGQCLDGLWPHPHADAGKAARRRHRAGRADAEPDRRPYSARAHDAGARALQHALGADHPLHRLPHSLHDLPDPRLHARPAAATSTRRPRIDGATEGQIFWKVILPLCRPIVVSCIILHVLFAWNEYLFAMVFTSGADMQTLPVGLTSIMAKHGTNYAVVFAAMTHFGAAHRDRVLLRAALFHPRSVRRHRQITLRDSHAPVQT